MKFTLALISGLCASMVAGLAIPSSNADVEVAALEERSPPTHVEVDSNDASLITVEAEGLYAQAESLIAFLLQATQGQSAYPGTRAWKKAATAGQKALAGIGKFVRLLGHHLRNDFAYQKGNQTLSDIEEFKYEFEQMINLNWTEYQNDIQLNLSEMLYDRFGVCESFAPAVNEIMDSARRLLEQSGHNATALDGLTVATPTQCQSNPSILPAA